MSTDIVTAARPMSVPVGREVDNIARIATNLAAAGIYAKTARTPEAVFAVLLAARDLGVSPTAALAGGIHMVDGKPEISANLQAQLLREYRGPEGQRFDYRILTPARERSKECHIEFRRMEVGGDWEVIGEEFFDLDDAKRAGLAGKQVWQAYPKMMLLARCLSDGIASHCPETARGLRVYGESEIGGQQPQPPVHEVSEPDRSEHADGRDEPPDAEVIPDRGEDAIAAEAKVAVDCDAIPKRTLGPLLRANGAQDTSSVLAALRSMAGEGLEAFRGQVAEAVALHEETAEPDPVDDEQETDAGNDAAENAAAVADARAQA